MKESCIDRLHGGMSGFVGRNVAKVVEGVTHLIVGIFVSLAVTC